jgi:hypothetical protein
MTKEHLTANSRLLQKLNAHINEDRVFSSISQLTKEVERIETISGRSLHTNKMRSEIAMLEDKLAYGKNQASLRTKQFRKITPED